MTRLVLASASPRRRELLARAGYEFEVLSADVTEHTRPHLSLRELTTANATRKALTIAGKRADAIVLAADTLVSLDTEIIGKPATIEQARRTLRRLSGHVHEVCTSVFITGPNGRFISFAEISRVEFHRLTASEIDNYIRKIDPLDKAGAYAAQNEGTQIIRSIAGSHTNVVGLPMEKTTRTLCTFGVLPCSGGL
jgi:septum formation protein